VHSSSSISPVLGTRVDPTTGQPQSQLSTLIARDRKKNTGNAKGKKHVDRSE
jgi:hypothetical protein